MLICEEIICQLHRTSVLKSIEKRRTVLFDEEFISSTVSTAVTDLYVLCFVLLYQDTVEDIFSDLHMPSILFSLSLV